MRWPWSSSFRPRKPAPEPGDRRNVVTGPVRRRVDDHPRDDEPVTYCASAALPDPRRPTRRLRVRSGEPPGPDELPGVVTTRDRADLDVLTPVGGVDHLAASDVDAHVALGAVEEDEVAGPQPRLGDVVPSAVLQPGPVRQPDTTLPPGHHGQARAVEGPRSRTAPPVLASELGLGVADGPARPQAHRHGLCARLLDRREVLDAALPD